jgi:hypothetical protein
MRTRTPSTAIAAVLSFPTFAAAQTLGDGLIAYWPLDEIVAGTQTPDVVNGLNMNLSANISAENIVPGVKNNAFHFDTSDSDMLSRVHTEGELLPINQYESFTISMWTQVLGTDGINNDFRMFSEASTMNTAPLFNIGTANGGGNNSVDIYIRRSNLFAESNHALTVATPLDGTWHHLVFVQSAGVRTMYIDGVLDGISIGAKGPTPWDVNNTTIGGIQRAAASHFVTGDIDEVALWNRALSDAEIADLNANGVPSVPTGGAPLSIRSFHGDFPAVVSGDTITLRWEVTGADSISIDGGIGPVDANTNEVGIGSVTVPISEATTFKMTATKGAETVEGSVRVRTVGQDVAPGWRVIDDFQTYAGAPIENQSRWNNTTGVASVLNLGENSVLSLTETGREIASEGFSLFYELGSLSIPEGASATLFFRLFVAEGAAFNLLDFNIGLTDKPVGFVFELSDDFGPWVGLDRAVGFDSTIQISARNGVGGALAPAPGSLDLGTVYGVWIDFQNNPIETGDTFSVHIQEDGAPDRTTLFQDFIADRNPASNLQPMPALSKILMAVPVGDGFAPDTVWVDDIYLSSGGFNGTVPVPASSFEDTTGGGAAADIRIVSVEYDAGFSLEWTSPVGATFEVLKNDTLDQDWAPVATGYPAGGSTGDTTSYSDSDASLGSAFYQVRLLSGGEPAAIFFDDFEGADMGWTVTNAGGAAQWESGPAGGNGPEAAFSGTNMWGTDLDADVGAGADTVLRSPLIDLTGYTTGRLSVQLWSDTSGEITVDALDEEGQFILADFLLTFSGTSPGWFKINITLPSAGNASAEPGQDFGVFGQRIYIAIRLNDPIGGTPGVFIDDFRIQN